MGETLGQTVAGPPIDDEEEEIANEREARR
jgi:hypothetical protein